jgi:hypothetical protein
MEKKIIVWMKEGFSNEDEEKKVAQFFLNQLYYEIYSKSLIGPLTIDSISVFKLFRTIL